MAPEMAAAYIVGWFPSAAVTGAQIWLHRKKVQAPAYRLLQKNLQKVGLLWREAHSDIESFEDGKEAQDLKTYEKNILLMGTFFLFLSWPGFLFNLVVLISVHSLAISRKERQLFSSDLTRREASPEEVQQILKECP